MSGSKTGYLITDGGVPAFVGTLSMAAEELCPGRELTEQQLRDWCEDHSYEIAVTDPEDWNLQGWRWKPGMIDDE